MSEEPIQVEGPYQNVFEALGLSEPDVRQAKNLARLALEDLLAARGLSQREAAKLIGVPQPNLARALKGRSGDVSFDQLFRFWTTLGGHVQISFLPGSGPTSGRVEAEGPGMRLEKRARPPAVAPAPLAKRSRGVAEAVASAKATAPKPKRNRA